MRPWLLTALATAAVACPVLAQPADTWGKDKAAGYLDDRMKKWSEWGSSQRDAGESKQTFCMCCHTTVPYALARTRIGTEAADTMKARQKVLYDDVAARVEKWGELEWYYDFKADESKGTEAVLNALILADRDALQSRPGLSPEAKRAFEILWETQVKDGDKAGSWAWLQFGNRYQPWEIETARYYGAALAGVAVGRAKAAQLYDFGTEADKNGIKRLTGYLTSQAGGQTLYNKLYFLWAAAELGLTPENQAQIVADVVAAQQQDGGWSTAKLLGMANRTVDTDSPTDKKSDGYATGLAVYALRKAKKPRDDPSVAKGMAWLKSAANRGPSGQWQATSLNRKGHTNPMVRLFMDDAATGFAVLALTEP